MAPINENAGTLFGIGASMLARSGSYSQEHKDDLSNFGAAIGNLMQERFYAKQVEDFQNNELAAFQTQQSAFYKALGTIEEPDKLAQAMSDWHYNTLMPFVTKNSMKYAKNQRIVGGLQAAIEAHNKGFDQFLGAAKFGVEAKAADAQITNEAERTRAYSSLTDAQIRQADAGARAHDASAALDYARAANEAGKDQVAGNSLLELIKGAQMLDPKITGGEDGIDSQTTRREISSYIARHQNETRPDGRKWGQPTEEGQPTEQAMALQILQSQPEDWQKKIIKGRIVQRHPLGPAVMKDPNVGAYFDEQYSPNRPSLRGAVPPPMLISVLTATPSNEQPFPAATVDQFIEEGIRKADDPSQLGGHIQSVFNSGGLRPNRTGEIEDSSGKVWTFDEKNAKKNREILAQALMSEYANKVRPMMADDDLTAQTRYDAERIGAEAVARFLPQVAARLDIKIPKGPTPRGWLQDFSARQLVGDAAQLVQTGPKASLLSGSKRNTKSKGILPEGYEYAE